MNNVPAWQTSLVESGARRFLAAESAVFSGSASATDGSAPVSMPTSDAPRGSGPATAPAPVAAIGTTAARAIKGELLPQAIRAAGFEPGTTSAWSTPEQLFADPAWQLGVVLSPWKQDIGPKCRLLAPSAEVTGVVDTVLRSKLGIVGFNTNTWAAQSALEALTSGIPPHRVLLVGSGASARSVALAVTRAWPKAELVIAGRSLSRTVALAKQFCAKLASAMEPGELCEGACEVVVNATTWGETEESEREPLGVDLSGVLVAGVRFFDLNNRISSLATQALSVGCTVQAGGLMQRVTHTCRAALLPFRVAGG